MKILSLLFCRNKKITCEKCTGFTPSFLYVLPPSKFKSQDLPGGLNTQVYGDSATTKCDTIPSNRPLASGQKYICILYLYL